MRAEIKSLQQALEDALECRESEQSEVAAGLAARTSLQKKQEEVAAAKEKVAEQKRILLDEARAVIRGVDFTIEDNGVSTFSEVSCAVAGGLVGGLVPKVGAVAGAAIAAGGLWYLGGGKRYKFAGWFHHDHEDRRPDSASLLELKHENPLYAKVRIVEGDRWKSMFVDNNPFGRQRLLHVSVEIVAQLATAKNMKPGSTPFVAWERIHSAASALQTVNYDRFLAVRGINLVQDSALFVYALWKRMNESNEALGPFPTADQ